MDTAITAAILPAVCLPAHNRPVRNLPALRSWSRWNPRPPLGGCGFFVCERSQNMVVIMKREFTPEQLEAAVHTMEEGGVKVMVSKLSLIHI